MGLSRVKISRKFFKSAIWAEQPADVFVLPRLTPSFESTAQPANHARPLNDPPPSDWFSIASSQRHIPRGRDDEDRLVADMVEIFRDAVSVGVTTKGDLA